MKKVIARTLTAAAVSGLVLVGLAAPASAHPHEATHAHQGEGQELANGQNHGPYVDNGDGDGVDDTSCGGDPAAYGLESAHHGPDAGTPGRADGCYESDGIPKNDVANDAIG